MSTNKLIINQSFNKEFAKLVSEYVSEIQMLLYCVTIDRSLEYKTKVLSISPRAKMAFVVMYYTGRDCLHKVFDSVQERKDFFDQELFLNYEEFFVPSRDYDKDKNVDLIMTEYAEHEAETRFYNLLGSMLTVFTTMSCLVILHERLQDSCDFGKIEIGHIKHWREKTESSIADFQKVYGVKIQR